MRTTLKAMHRSILYAIKKLDEKVNENFSAPNKSCLLNDIKSELDILEPIKDLDTFYNFDNKIKNYDNFRGLIVSNK